jgi:integrative and conjugative element protein (TIGR02256 family)
MILKITKSAYQSIKSESLKHATETGGILIGTLRHPVVIRASCAGSLADLSVCSYSNDAAHDSKHLQTAIRDYDGKVKLVGYWHKHPGNMSQLSAMDIETARGIIKRAEKQEDHRPVFFMITNVVGHDVKLYCYMLNDRSGVTAVATKFINDGSPEVIKALNLEPAIVRQKKVNFWDDPGFQFYMTKTGSERLQQEVDELKSHGFSVKAYAREHVYLTISKYKETLICVLPPEYPLNPPRFFRGKDEIDYQLPIWNSSMGIIDIVQRISRESMIARRDYESHNTQTGSRCRVFLGTIRKAFAHLWLGKKRGKPGLRPEHR